jgi:hypothetical protein
MSQSEVVETEREYPHWGRIYAAVIFFQIIVVIGLWLFSKAFEP